MPFEDFYKKDDRNTFDRRKIFGSILLAIFAWFCFILFATSSKPETQDEINQLIARSKTLTRLDQICMNEMPKPEKFYFRYKTLRGNSFTSAISYQFQTKRSYEEISAFFRVWLNSNDWTENKTRTLEFNKTNQKIVIARVGFPNADYSIYCAEINQ